MNTTASTAAHSSNTSSFAAATSSTDPLGTVPTTSSPAHANPSRVQRAFDHFASYVTRWAGSPGTFCAGIAVVLIWAAAGPAFGFSETWQLVINTGTTIITFLMVFLIQQSQNKDSVAIHLKLDELIASSKRASNAMIAIEEMDEQDLREAATHYAQLAGQARAASDGPHGSALAACAALAGSAAADLDHAAAEAAAGADAGTQPAAAQCQHCRQALR